MTSFPTTGLALNRSFRASLLLTGSVALAEAAILSAIDEIDPEELTNEALFRKVTIAAIAVGSAASRNLREAGEPPSALPIELKRVLRLPTDRRQCFVLRFLAGLSREDAAHMLSMSPHLVDERAGAAATELASVSQVEGGDLTTGAKPYGPSVPCGRVDNKRRSIR